MNSKIIKANSFYQHYDREMRDSVYAFPRVFILKQIEQFLKDDNGGIPLNSIEQEDIEKPLEQMFPFERHVLALFLKTFPADAQNCYVKDLRCKVVNQLPKFELNGFHLLFDSTSSNWDLLKEMISDSRSVGYLCGKTSFEFCDMVRLVDTTHLSRRMIPFISLNREIFNVEFSTFLTMITNNLIKGFSPEKMSDADFYAFFVDMEKARTLTLDHLFDASKKNKFAAMLRTNYHGEPNASTNFELFDRDLSKLFDGEFYELERNMIKIVEKAKERREDDEQSDED